MLYCEERWRLGNIRGLKKTSVRNINSIATKNKSEQQCAAVFHESVEDEAERGVGNIFKLWFTARRQVWRCSGAQVRHYWLLAHGYTEDTLRVRVTMKANNKHEAKATRVSVHPSPSRHLCFWEGMFLTFTLYLLYPRTSLSSVLSPPFSSNA